VFEIEVEIDVDVDVDVDVDMDEEIAMEESVCAHAAREKGRVRGFIVNCLFRMLNLDPRSTIDTDLSPIGQNKMIKRYEIQ
jgi:hypothetical protein